MLREEIKVKITTSVSWKIMYLSPSLFFDFYNERYSKCQICLEFFYGLGSSYQEAVDITVRNAYYKLLQNLLLMLNFVLLKSFLLYQVNYSGNFNL